MGLYDTIRSSYNLGPDFTDVELQTKDIDCTMSHYWISPDGVLYLIDYTGTSDLKKIYEGDPDYSEKFSFLNFRWIPNGNHGKVRPEMITKYVTAYPSRIDGKWTEVKLHFRYGKLQDFEQITYD
jgi:hypothetical protein